MERREEYEALLKALQETPPALAGTMERVERKMRSSRRLRAAQSVLGGAAALILAFVLLINTFPSFATACGQVPLLKELAQAVAFSPSLSAAVENAYVQPIDEEQSAGVVTARVEYVIVDQKQLNIFYTLTSPRYQKLAANVSIAGIRGEQMEGYSLSMGDWDAASGELQHCTVDFIDGEMPPGLRLSLEVYDNSSGEEADIPTSEALWADWPTEEANILEAFVFDLHFDPAYTAQGEVLTLNQTFKLDSQQLTLTTAEIYPTHIRINFNDAPENTAWLKSLSFYLEDERGRRYEAIANGISASGSPDSPMMVSHRLESSYFAQARQLTLYITEVTWLDKNMERVRLDLANQTAEQLPQGVVFQEAKRLDKGWQLTFIAQRRQAHASYQLFGSQYYSEDGSVFDINSWSSGGSPYTEADGRRIEDEMHFMTTIPLYGYTEEIVYLCPSYSRFVKLEQLVAIPLKE